MKNVFMDLENSADRLERTKWVLASWKIIHKETKRWKRYLIDVPDREYKEMPIFEVNMTKNLYTFIKSMTHLIQKIQKIPNNISTVKTMYT